MFVMKSHAADMDGYMKGRETRSVGGGGGGGECLDEHSIGSPGLSIPSEDITERIPVSFKMFRGGRGGKPIFREIEWGVGYS